MDIDAQEENILAEYESGWAARAARDPDDEILKSGVKPVRYNGEIIYSLDGKSLSRQ